MSHPRHLELYACRDLGRWQSYLVQRHVSRCEACQAEVARYRRFWNSIDWKEADPAIADWDALAGEMKANVRLGLAAGACVGGVLRPRDAVLRPALALASLAALMTAAYLSREQPVRRPPPTIVATTGAGVQARAGEQVFEVGPPASAPVRLESVNARGEARSRFVDAETSDVTIVNMYAQ